MRKIQEQSIKYMKDDERDGGVGLKTFPKLKVVNPHLKDVSIV